MFAVCVPWLDYVLKIKLLWCYICYDRQKDLDHNVGRRLDDIACYTFLLMTWR